MAEPGSLYMRIAITEKALEDYKSSQPIAAGHYEDWRRGLWPQDSLPSVTAEEILRLTPPNVASVGEYLARSLRGEYCLIVEPSDEPPGNGYSHYDPVSRTWTFLLMFFVEDCYGYMEGLAVLRAVERFKDLPGMDFILCYNYVFGGPSHYLEISQGSSRFVESIPSWLVAEGERKLEEWEDQFGGDGFVDEEE